MKRERRDKDREREVERERGREREIERERRGKDRETDQRLNLRISSDDVIGLKIRLGKNDAFMNICT